MLKSVFTEVQNVRYGACMHLGSVPSVLQSSGRVGGVGGVLTHGHVTPTLLRGSKGGWPHRSPPADEEVFSPTASLVTAPLPSSPTKRSGAAKLPIVLQARSIQPVSEGPQPLSCSPADN